MKVGIDTTPFLGDFDNGKEQVLLNLLKGFEDNGVGSDIVILCYQNRYSVYKKIIPSAQFRMLTDLPVATNLFMRIITKILKTKRVFLKLKEFVYENDLDLLLFSSKKSAGIKFNIPTVVIPHDIQVVSHPERFELPAFIYKYEVWKDFFYRDIVISISDFDASEMKEYFPKYSSKIRKIYNPIICEGEMYRGERSGILALNVNYPHKNAITLLKAYNLIKNKIDEKLIIAGKLTNKECLEYIKDQNLEKDVLLTGYLEEEELKELMSKARLFINPSLYEGFGMTPIEAIIRGVPTLIYKGTASFETTQGLCEYYENGTDEKELAAKMLELLHKPIDLEVLKKKSDVLKQEYNYQMIAKQYWHLFCDLLEDK